MYSFKVTVPFQLGPCFISALIHSKMKYKIQCHPSQSSALTVGIQILKHRECFSFVRGLGARLWCELPNANAFTCVLR